MKKIKPEVIGFQRVFNSGNVATSVYEMKSIGKMVDYSAKTRGLGISIHSNGKPKFRLVYKKD